MQYKYRFVYVCFVLIFIVWFGYTYDSKPLLESIHSQVALIKDLEAKLSYAKTPQQKNEIEMEDNTGLQHIQGALLSNLSVLSNRLGVRIVWANFSAPHLPFETAATQPPQGERMHVRPEEGAERLFQGEHISVRPEEAHEVRRLEGLHLKLKGDFKQILHFLFSLKHQVYPMTITDFNFMYDENNHPAFEMQLLILKVKMKTRKSLQSIDTFSNSPLFFCPPHFQLKSYDTSHLLAFPLEDIKMVGYIKQDHLLQAFIALPDGSMHAISIGMQLGKEKAIVKRIDRHQIDLLLDNKKHSGSHIKHITRTLSNAI